MNPTQTSRRSCASAVCPSSSPGLPERPLSISLERSNQKQEAAVLWLNAADGGGSRRHRHHQRGCSEMERIMSAIARHLENSPAPVAVQSLFFHQADHYQV